MLSRTMLSVNCLAVREIGFMLVQNGAGDDSEHKLNIMDLIRESRVPWMNTSERGWLIKLEKLDN